MNRSKIAAAIIAAASINANAADPAVNELRLDNHYQTIMENYFKVENARDRLDVAEVRLDNHYTSIIENRLLVNNARNRLDAAEYRLDTHANEIIGNYIRIQNTNDRIDFLGEDISYLRSELYSGMSAVSAMGAIPQALDGQTSIGVGYGHFGGENAAAIGISTRRGAHAFTLQGSVTSEENGVSAGYSFSF